MLSNTDTIAAIATPAGTGGVGIIRISGANAKNIAVSLSGLKDLKNSPRPFRNIQKPATTNHRLRFNLVF